MNRFIAAWILVVMFLHHPLGWCRSSRSNLEDRIENLENKLESNLNLEITSKLEELQKEIQELRGMLEEKQHAAASLNSASLDPKNIVNAKNNSNPEQNAYDLAYKLVEEKNFAEAIVAFKDFLGNYSSGQYAPNAIYWLGELYLTEHNFNIAADYFLQVVDQYKDHTKAPDALLKLGMLEIDRENWQEAKNYFNKIKKDYANSSRVHMAEASLQSLQKDGH